MCIRDSHVAVRGNRDGTQQVRGQAGGDEDSGRAIGAADYADGSGFLVGEAQDFGKGGSSEPVWYGNLGTYKVLLPFFQTREMTAFSRNILDLSLIHI